MGGTLLPKPGWIEREKGRIEREKHTHTQM